MEIEKDKTIPFHETTVTRDSDSLLTTTVYRKPNHTNQYLAYDSHHLQSVKCGIVKYLYQWAKHLTMKLSVTSKEKKHLNVINTCFWWLSFFIYMKTRKDNKGNSTVLHYIEGVFEVFCCCLQHQGIWTIFKSDTTLRSHLVWNKKVPFTRSHVNVAKCISAKQGDQCIKDKGTWQRHTVFSYCGFREC